MTQIDLSTTSNIRNTPINEVCVVPRRQCTGSLPANLVRQKQFREPTRGYAGFPLLRARKTSTSRGFLKHLKLRSNNYESPSAALPPSPRFNSSSSSPFDSPSKVLQSPFKSLLAPSPSFRRFELYTCMFQLDRRIAVKSCKRGFSPSHSLHPSLIYTSPSSLPLVTSSLSFEIFRREVISRGSTV